MMSGGKGYKNDLYPSIKPLAPAKKLT